MYAYDPAGVNHSQGVAQVMVTTESRTEKFVTIASSRRAAIRLDAPVPKCGEGALTDAQREALTAAAASCPLRPGWLRRMDIRAITP